ncbi:hypothetical protein M3P21_21000 [Ruegeria sp. 2012CJ41-6]|uniref:Uncharacterized protein n=1 Tax=Ruegeria spongiae TaxID=2942209 RepID=A0ABT0Q873_9RHOB|nr:hypothetical protein [Ruegeria spongiae]MCL6285997.1 hypothetical protein [Ruegeria spongiae]
MQKLHIHHIIDLSVGPFDLLVELWPRTALFKVQRDYPDELVVDVWRLRVMFTFHRKKANTHQMTTTT